MGAIETSLHVYASIRELKIALNSFSTIKHQDRFIKLMEAKIYPVDSGTESFKYAIKAVTNLKLINDSFVEDIGSIRFTAKEIEPSYVSRIDFSVFAQNDNFGIYIIHEMESYFSEQFDLVNENERPQPFPTIITVVSSEDFVKNDEKEIGFEKRESKATKEGANNSQTLNKMETQSKDVNFTDLPADIFSVDIESYDCLKNCEIMKQYYPSYNFEEMKKLITATRELFEEFKDKRSKGRWGPAKFLLVSKNKASTISRYFFALYSLGVRTIDNVPIPYSPRKNSNKTDLSDLSK